MVTIEKNIDGLYYLLDQKIQKYWNGRKFSNNLQEAACYKDRGKAKKERCRLNENFICTNCGGSIKVALVQPYAFNDKVDIEKEAPFSSKDGLRGNEQEWGDSMSIVSCDSCLSPKLDGYDKRYIEFFVGEVVNVEPV